MRKLNEEKKFHIGDVISVAVQRHLGPNGSQGIQDTAIKEQDSYEEGSFLIYSPNEAAAGGGSDDGFWSNDDGWTTLEGATRFSEDESQNLNLPVSLGQDAKWISFDEAEAQCADNDLKFAGIDTLSPAVDHLRPRG